MFIQLQQLPPTLCLRHIQISARGQIGVFFKMFRAQRLGNHMLAAQPFAEINQFTAVRAKRAVLSGKPIALLFAGWTDDFGAAFTHRYLAINMWFEGWFDDSSEI